MREWIAMGVALSVSVAGAVALQRVVVPALGTPTITTLSEPEPMETAPVVEAPPAPKPPPLPPAPSASAATITAPEPPPIAQAVAAVVPTAEPTPPPKHEERRPEPTPRHKTAGGRPVDPQAPADLTAVEALAQQMAPQLSHQAGDLSGGQKPQVVLEVEPELLQVLKEQQDILAGKRSTIDSELKDPSSTPP